MKSGIENVGKDKDVAMIKRIGVEIWIEVLFGINFGESLLFALLYDSHKFALDIFVFRI